MHTKLDTSLEKVRGRFNPLCIGYNIKKYINGK